MCILKKMSFVMAGRSTRHSNGVLVLTAFGACVMHAGKAMAQDDILAEWRLAETVEATVNDFGSFPGADVYHLVVIDNSIGDVNTMGLTFVGSMINAFSLTTPPGNFSVSNTVDLPFGLPETFMIIPTGDEDILVHIADDDERFEVAAFVQEADFPFIPIGVEQVIAVVSVPVGGLLPVGAFEDGSNVMVHPSVVGGGNTVDGVFAIRVIPEPSSLVSIAIVGSFIFRRR